MSGIDHAVTITARNSELGGLPMPRTNDDTPAGPPDDARVDHRWGERRCCRAHVRFSTGTGITGAGKIRDISSSGAFIETAAELLVEIQLDLFILGNESANEVVETTAMIVRVERCGIAVEWSSTPPRSICSAIGCSVPCAEPVPANQK